MIDLSSLAQTLQDAFNAIATRDNVGFTFDIKYAKNKVGGQSVKVLAPQQIVITGELLPMPSGVIPLQGLNIFYSAHTLNIVSPREQLDEVIAIVQEYAETNTGGEFSIGDYAGRGIYQMPNVLPPLDNISMRFGNVVTMQADYLFVKNGVFANSTVIELDGERMFAINWNVKNDKTPSMNNVANSPLLTAQIQAQNVQYSWMMYYRNTPVIKELIKEIHGEKPLEQTHALTWYDGVTYTEQTPKSVVLRLVAGSYSGSAGDIPQIEVHFTTATQIGNAANPPTL